MKTLLYYALAVLFASLAITLFEFSGKNPECAMALKSLGCVSMFGYYTFLNKAGDRGD